MKKKLIMLSSFVMGLAPVVAFAQVNAQAPGCVGKIGIPNIICRIGGLLNLIIPIVIALGLVYFVWGIISYVIASDEEAKTTGRDRMIYGIIGLAVIVAVWGLVNILLNTFGVGPGTVVLPTL